MMTIWTWRNIPDTYSRIPVPVSSDKTEARHIFLEYPNVQNPWQSDLMPPPGTSRKEYASHWKAPAKMLLFD